MEDPKALDEVFEKKLFRIPDYQRGYAWQPEQLRDFWEDLMNLAGGRQHYTGVLTLNRVPADEIEKTDPEYFLTQDYRYKLYHVVDGQQRLTTFVVFLQAFIELVRSLPEHREKSDAEIFVSGTLHLAEVQRRFLYVVNPRGDEYRAYKFGYTVDNPSYKYLRHRIFSEANGGPLQETVYTLNLGNAKKFFTEQLKELHSQQGLAGLEDVYRKLTERFMFNEYIIKDDFDVFVAFETMNNRGKHLSNLELLKNRLIYLTTLYEDKELDPAARRILRDAVNDAWKEVYYWLGRNKAEPLKDDEFLTAHWIVHFSRQGGNPVQFLLNRHFTPQRVHRKVEREVPLQVPEERPGELDVEKPADEEDIEEETPIVPTAQLPPHEIRNFVNNLKDSVEPWFNTFHPYQALNMPDEERHWIERLNRIGIAYFRPLVMTVLKKEQEDAEKRTRIFQRIERFVFLALRMAYMRSNYGESEVYTAASQLDQGKIDLDEIERRLDAMLSVFFNQDGSLRTNEFYNVLYRLFEAGRGYYGWSGLRYFLYEYELDLLDQSRQKKVEWEDLLKPGRDRITIEHIYPQTETPDWATAFKDIQLERRPYYGGSLGNLLLLSGSINSSLQNDSFANKKHPRYDPRGRKIRNGYSDGSHSEIEISQNESWGPDEIHERGLKLLKFMERRWDFRFPSENVRESLLFLSSDDEEIAGHK